MAEEAKRLMLCESAPDLAVLHAVRADGKVGMAVDCWRNEDRTCATLCAAFYTEGVLGGGRMACCAALPHLQYLGQLVEGDYAGA